MEKKKTGLNFLSKGNKDPVKKDLKIGISVAKKQWKNGKLYLKLYDLAEMTGEQFLDWVEDVYPIPVNEPANKFENLKSKMNAMDNVIKTHNLFRIESALKGLD